MAPNAVDWGSIPGQGTMILHAAPKTSWNFINIPLWSLDISNLTTYINGENRSIEQPKMRHAEIGSWKDFCLNEESKFPLC